MVTAKKMVILLMMLCRLSIIDAQLMTSKETFTKADTLRGSNNENRDWWDVLKYQISVKPDIKHKTIEGSCQIVFKVIKKGSFLQIDLQDSLIIDEVKVGTQPYPQDKEWATLPFIKKEGVYLISLPDATINKNESIKIKYHGKPKEAINAPWDGGWVWKKDSLGNPWVSVACQGLGASCWYPCKDLQSDEPDSGATLAMEVPDSLNAVANGRCKNNFHIDEQKCTKWEVKNPINNYDIIPYIGKYTNFTDTFMGEGGKLDLSFWVLNYNLEKAQNQFTQVKPMLRCFEYWFGKYPFYEDSYKLVEAPYLGMENQSAVAYGNGFLNGYHGADLSATGWGLKWDFIIIHESGHEWFGNSITSNDLADMWIHESFTMYSEILYTQWLFGEQAGNEYCIGLRHNIQNDKPIIAPYGVNKEGSGDMYYKGANMLHSIRHIINNDSLFKKILRGMNTEFYHQTVTTKQIEDFIIAKSGIDLQPIFNQYLTTVNIPHLVYSIDAKKSLVTLHWTNCANNFIMPITIPVSANRMNITTQPKSIHLTSKEIDWLTKENLEKYYYIDVN